MSPPRDRWHELDDAVDTSGLPASDRSVYRALLKRADYVTADLPLKFTPTQEEIRRVTGLSVRQVRYSVRHLELHGWLEVSGKTGRGHTPEYKLVSGVRCECHGGRVHARAKAATTAPFNGVKAATTAAQRRQPKAATPQVTPRIALRGSEREDLERWSADEQDGWTR